MSHKAKLFIFVPCVLLGIYLQLDLGIQCRCAWGDWTSHFFVGALTLDSLLLVRIGYSAFRHRFFDDCLVVGAIVLTSFFWIPLLYKTTTAAYLIATEGHVGQLGH